MEILKQKLSEFKKEMDKNIMLRYFNTVID